MYEQQVRIASVLSQTPSCALRNAIYLYLLLLKLFCILLGSFVAVHKSLCVLHI